MDERDALKAEIADLRAKLAAMHAPSICGCGDQITHGLPEAVQDGALCWTCAADLREKLAEAEQSASLQWDAQQRAIKLWQAAHPDKADRWPDTANLLLWLMEQNEA